MQILPIITSLLQPGDHLASVLRASATFQPDDIIIVSSKAAAVCEGTIHDLTTLVPSPLALTLSNATGRSAAFCELVLLETNRWKGEIKGTAPGAILTEVSPTGMTGSILLANAGLDESNVEKNHAVGWPLDPVRTVHELRRTLDVAVILSDSLCIPRRLGVIAIALAVSGIDPHRSLIGTNDLFGKEMKITNEAIADQLATAANAVMGNAAQSTPAAIIRDHGIPQSDFEGWVPGMKPSDDLFAALFK